MQKEDVVVSMTFRRGALFFAGFAAVYGLYLSPLEAQDAPDENGITQPSVKAIFTANSPTP